MLQGAREWRVLIDQSALSLMRAFTPRVVVPPVWGSSSSLCEVLLPVLFFAISTFPVEAGGQYDHASVLRWQHASIAMATWTMLVALFPTTWIKSTLQIMVPHCRGESFFTTGGISDMMIFGLNCGISMAPRELRWCGQLCQMLRLLMSWRLLVRSLPWQDFFPKPYSKCSASSC